ncbi:hypothetical protein [Longimicrobium sp.]|uniref:hypothetical protein n=1 Tax=Longimicrobium sp. TaxID=2029185 RepID=UPI002BDD7F18|nr:hypothetical protein [Longimicrobium sp.]HSU17993.1 hypothetical protein [Longimicrobium sp.]
MTSDDEYAAGVDVWVEGGANVTQVAGRDLYVQMAAEEFVRLDADAVRGEAAPRAVGDLVRQLADQRLLVLAGAYEDKARVARHVAVDLASREQVPVLEWAGEGGLDALLRGMRRKESAVVLLSGILPQQVDWNLPRLRSDAARARQWVIATTDRRHREWNLTPGQDAFWHEIAPDRLFDSDTLLTVLLHELGDIRGALGDGAYEEAYEPGDSTLCGLALREIAERLRTPPNVEEFGRRLLQRARSGGLEREGIESLADAITSPAVPIRRWFNTPPRSDDERLLALGMAFFEGLPDDQFFAAMERWVADIRERRDPRQRSFDYADVARLEDFFARVETADGGIRWEPRWPDQRAFILRAGWDGHRRQMLGALDVLTRLAADSAEGRGGDRELYGSPGERLRVRRAVTGALGELGLLSPAGVEPALLELASDADADVQGVAAAAVAGWRLRGGEAEARFFALLKRWQRDARIRGIVESLLAGRDERKSGGAHAQIRATVALALGFASEYDPPGGLKPDLVTLMKELAGDRNRIVRERFARYTLPKMVRLHVAQLRPTLRGLARRSDLAFAIGASLAQASPTLPDDVGATLDEWHLEVSRWTPGAGRAGEREALLMVLAYTYGELPYGEGSPVRAEDGFARLRQILATERHPRVRSAAVHAVARQVRTRFGHVEPMVRALAGDLTGRERERIALALADVYRAEREGMKGGDAEVEVGGRTYAAWTEGSRETTPVERAMLRWMQDASAPAAQRIALRAAVAFAETLDGAIADEIARIRDERRRADTAPRPWDAAALPAPPSAPGWYGGGLVPWLATVRAPAFRPVVRGLLPEALAQRTHRPLALSNVLARWEAMRVGSRPRDVARILRIALAWYFGGALLVALLIIFIVILLLEIF